MIGRKNIADLNDFFVKLNKRPQMGVYFCRINGYSNNINDFIIKYYEEARKNGVIIDGRIPNPTESNLSYYEEMMGREFVMSVEFVEKSLRKWLPRINEHERKEMATSIIDVLNTLKKQGKNDNMLKNTYIKFMCWLYYKFERIANKLGDNDLPKILYQGSVTNYELLILSVLSKAGCDIVLLQTAGDEAYKKLDPTNAISESYEKEPLSSFPKEFGIKNIVADIQKKADMTKLYGDKTVINPCTNAWIKGNGLEDVKVLPKDRGTDSQFFYNCFIRINGVDDKSMYLNDLYQLYVELNNEGRNMVIVDGDMEVPNVDEIAFVKRENYQSVETLVSKISHNLIFISNNNLRQIVKKAFIDEMMKLSQTPGISLNKLVNKAVFLICYIKRYYNNLFAKYKDGDISCFIHMGACKSENDVMFLELLANTPVDVLILNPDLTNKCMLENPTLYEINNEFSLVADSFPKSNSNTIMGTTAYEAERELNTLLYQDTGLYRNRQFVKMNTITLKTMYEEIEILWKNELKYRPNFSTVEDVVSVPVIFAKVCGVKNGEVTKYFDEIRKLITEDTVVIKEIPSIKPTDNNPIKPYATEFYKNRKLQKSKVKSHQAYQYGYLKEEIQDLILDKLEMLIESKIIKGTFETGIEYLIVSTVLNLKKEIVRLIQKFDFTKVNPKLIYISVSEDVFSLEDAIVMAYLNLIGFDIILFVPTGYESEGKFYTKQILETHEVGEYMYDLEVPSTLECSSNTNHKWFDKIFKRGR